MATSAARPRGRAASMTRAPRRQAIPPPAARAPHGRPARGRSASAHGCAPRARAAARSSSRSSTSASIASSFMSGRTSCRENFALANSAVKRRDRAGETLERGEDPLEVLVGRLGGAPRQPVGRERTLHAGVRRDHRPPRVALGPQVVERVVEHLREAPPGASSSARPSARRLPASRATRPRSPIAEQRRRSTTGTARTRARSRPCTSPAPPASGSRRRGAGCGRSPSLREPPHHEHEEHEQDDERQPRSSRRRARSRPARSARSCGRRTRASTGTRTAPNTIAPGRGSRARRGAPRTAGAGDAAAGGASPPDATTTTRHEQRRGAVEHERRAGPARPAAAR